MNDRALSPTTEFRPWWIVALCAAVIPACVSLFAWMVMFDMERMALDDGHAFECDGCGPNTYQFFSPTWVGAFWQAAGAILLASLCFTGLLTLLMRTAERHQPRTMIEWEYGGLAVVTPFALLGAYVPFLQPGISFGPFVLAALYFFLLAIFTAAFARRIRYGRAS